MPPGWFVAGVQVNLGGPPRKEHPAARIVGVGPGYLNIFESLCRESRAAGKLVADAQHAVITIEHGCIMVSMASDFSRFPGLRWQHPPSPGGMEVVHQAPTGIFGLA